MKFGTGNYKNIYESEKDPENYKYICPKCDGQKEGGVRSLSFEKKKKKK